MPELAVIMIGMDGWEAWTKPALNSIRAYMPDVPIIVIDHGREAYPNYPGAQIVRLKKPASYSHAINTGISMATPADWYLIINNDVEVFEPLDVSKLDPAFIYTKRILYENHITWIDSWLVLVSQQVWDLVGAWDEKFLMCGFEDADWCIRAADLGIAIQPLEWNIKHYWGKTRWALPGYKEQRLKNIQYLNEKHRIDLGKNVKVIYG